MKLRAYTEHGPAQFSATPVVLIKVQETIETRGLVHDLLTWLNEQELYDARSLCVGGGTYVALWEPSDAELVVTWLRERGVQQPGE